MEITTRATVRSWDDEQGWGVLDSGATPGGCWTHFSSVDVDGHRSLSAGQQVELVAEPAGQDGFAWRAVRVRVDGARPAQEAEVMADETGAYSSELTIDWDDDGPR